MPRLLAVALVAVLSGAALPLAPMGGPLSAALADDDDDDDFYRSGGGDDDWDDDDDNDDDDDDDDDRRRRFVAPAAPPAAIIVAVPAEIVVGPLTADDLARIAANGFIIIADAPVAAFGGSVIARVALPAGVTVEAARIRITGIVPAALVEPNHLYRPVEMPCLPGNCPAFEMIGWQVPPDECGVATTVGMIDTRINVEHPALSGRAIEVVSVVDGADRESAAMHGTAIAALLVGDGAGRTPGLLPRSRLVAVEAFHRDIVGDAADVFKIVRALDALQVRGVAVANLSFAGPPNALLEVAVARAAESSMVLVAAAGNLGPGAPPAYPAAYDGVVAVTALDRNNRVFRQAGQGDHIAFAAPGVRLWTAASISGGRYRSGTSYAVPFVTAAIAVAASAEGSADPQEIVAELAARSLDLGSPGRDPVFGWGAVRAGC